MANLAYVIVKTLRNAGIDAELLMQKYPAVTADPKSLDTELDSYPSWIKFWDNRSKDWKKQILKHMRDKQYDLIHTYVELPIFGLLSRRPFIAHTQGSDMKELAFERSIKGMLLRRAYHKAKAVIFFQPHHLPLIQKLKLNNAIFIAPPWDVNRFSPKQAGTKQNDEKIVIFHPTAQIWRLKGNDKFIKAFVRLCKERDDVYLYLIERGEDLDRAKDLLTEPLQNGKVHFIHGPLKQSGLVEYYNMCDIIADQFTLGSVGSIGWETLSCKKPLLAFIHSELYARTYGEAPPIVNVNDEDSIYDALCKLITSRSLREEIGEASRQWITRYHSADTFVKKCTRLYEGILNKEDMEETKEAVKSIKY